MIRFIDITKDYFALDDGDTLVGMPICCFINTVTNMFIVNDGNEHTFHDFHDIASIHENYRERCRGLVPDGFFDLTSDYWKQKLPLEVEASIKHTRDWLKLLNAQPKECPWPPTGSILELIMHIEGKSS